MGAGASERTEITTKTPNNIVVRAVKLTRKASEPNLATPELSRNVSFSKNPSEALATAKTYTRSPNTTCHGIHSLLRVELPPG